MIVPADPPALDTIMPLRRKLRRLLPVTRIRSLVTSCALLGYLTAALGVPLPQVTTKAGGAPFPCQHHACGCSSAEECWRGCCCFTAAQRLAWAIANRI